MGFMVQGGRLRCWYSTRLRLYQATRPHLECHNSHKGLLTNFKWFIVACVGRSGECCYFIRTIWMKSFGGFPSNWILLAQLGLKLGSNLIQPIEKLHLVHELSKLLEAMWTPWRGYYLQMKMACHRQKGCHLHWRDLPHMYKNHHNVLAFWRAKKTFDVLPKVLFR